jgi:Lipocalin-like domain
MGRSSVVRIVALAMLLLAALPGSATSQQKSLKEQLLGTWILVSHESVRPDGSRTPVYGLNPNGIAFFDAGGHFIITVMRSDRAKYAVENPTQGTPEENKATAQGTITYFGSYSVSEADGRIAIHIEASSFPNWNGADQIRTFAIVGGQLTLIAPVGRLLAQTGGHAEVIWKRAN